MRDAAATLKLPDTVSCTKGSIAPSSSTIARTSFPPASTALSASAARRGDPPAVDLLTSACTVRLR